MRATLTLILCLLLAACAVPFTGGDSEDTLAAADGSFVLKLPSGWSVKQKYGVDNGRASVLAHKDAAESGTGYPTVIVRELKDPTPQGVLEVMAKDRDLLFSELWTVSPEKYQLKQAVLDDSSRRLSYWLAPKDGSGLEYYATVTLTASGRVEMIGVAQAGTVARYMKDFNLLFSSLKLEDKARFKPGASGETGAYFRKMYGKAVGRERDQLTRQAAETAAWVRSAAGLSSQETGFLTGTYVRSVSKALEDGAALETAVTGSAGRDLSATLARLGESLDAQATALETIQLNLRDSQARTSVEKSAARARRMAQLAREAARLPL